MYTVKEIESLFKSLYDLDVEGSMSSSGNMMFRTYDNLDIVVDPTDLRIIHLDYNKCLGKPQDLTVTNFGPMLSHLKEKNWRA